MTIYQKVALAVLWNADTGKVTLRSGYMKHGLEVLDNDGYNRVSDALGPGDCISVYDFVCDLKELVDDLYDKLPDMDPIQAGIAYLEAHGRFEELGRPPKQGA
jgi:hypothetical protein